MLIKELFTLKEARAPYAVFQVKIESARDTSEYRGERVSGGQWEDLEFDHIHSLDELADEISDDYRDSKKIFKALPELHQYMQEYHVGLHPLNNEVFDVVDESYDIQSYKNDVLKVAYRFTARWKDKDDVTYRGIITFMPAN